MDEEKLTNILKAQREEYQNYLGTVTEQFESQIKLIGESAIGIEKQLSLISGMIAKNPENIEIMKMDIQFIKQELKGKVDLDEFNNLEKRVMFLEKKVGNV
ncbi:MAG: hypothetical protein ABH967_02120 [Patescibacteria group bacterium]